MLRQNSKVVAGSHEVVVEERGKLVTSETRCGECGVAVTAITSLTDMGKDGPGGGGQGQEFGAGAAVVRVGVRGRGAHSSCELLCSRRS